MILGITGHRPPTLGGYNIPNPTYEAVKDALRDRFKSISPSKIISGMAQGTDQWAAEVAIEMGIPFIAAVPCDNQDKMWPDHAKKVFKDLLDKADEIVVVTPGEYTKSCMHDRDRWIVDNSDCLLGVWNGQRFGGTFATIRMAEKQIAKGREYSIYRIDPSNL